MLNLGVERCLQPCGHPPHRAELAHVHSTCLVKFCLVTLMGNCIASVQQRPVYSRVAEADGNILYFLSKSSGRLADYSICANVFTGFGRHCRTYHSEAWAQR